MYCEITGGQVEILNPEAWSRHYMLK